MKDMAKTESCSRSKQRLETMKPISRNLSTINEEMSSDNIENNCQNKSNAIPPELEGKKATGIKNKLKEKALLHLSGTTNVDNYATLQQKSTTTASKASTQKQKFGDLSISELSEMKKR